MDRDAVSRAVKSYSFSLSTKNITLIPLKIVPKSKTLAPAPQIGVLKPSSVYSLSFAVLDMKKNLNFISINQRRNSLTLNTLW